MKYSFGRERITPPCFAFTQSFFTCFQKTRASMTIRKTAPAAIRIVLRGLGDVAEVLVERTGNGQEQVQVDERAGDREEDLLDEVGGERTGNVQAGMMATNMTSVANVPMFAGRKLFIDTPTA